MICTKSKKVKSHRKRKERSERKKKQNKKNTRKERKTVFNYKDILFSRNGEGRILEGRQAEGTEMRVGKGDIVKVPNMS